MLSLTNDELEYLHAALDYARDGRLDELQELVKLGLPINLTSPAGDSLLMLACYHIHPDVVRLLLLNGADTERVNDRGQTALGAAVFRNSHEIVTALLSAGAKPEGGRRTAVQIAEFYGLTDIAEQLRSVRVE